MSLIIYLIIGLIVRVYFHKDLFNLETIEYNPIGDMVIIILWPIYLYNKLKRNNDGR